MVFFSRVVASAGSENFIHGSRNSNLDLVNLSNYDLLCDVEYLKIFKLLH